MYRATASALLLTALTVAWQCRAAYFVPSNAAIEAKDFLIPSPGDSVKDPSYFRVVSLSLVGAHFHSSFVRAQMDPAVSAPANGMYLPASALAAAANVNCTEKIALVSPTVDQLRSGGFNGNFPVTNAFAADPALYYRSFVVTLSRAILIPFSVSQVALMIPLTDSAAWSGITSLPLVVNTSVLPSCFAEANVKASFTLTVAALPAALSVQERNLLVAVVAMGLLAPHAAMHGPRAAVPLLAKHCLSEPGELPLFQSPITLTLLRDNSAVGHWLGASVSMLAIICGAVTLQLLVATVLQRLRKSSWVIACFWARFPSLTTITVLPLLTQISAAATRVLMSSDKRAQVAAVCCIIVCLALTSAALVFTALLRRITYVPLQGADAPGSSSTIWHFFWGRGRWEDKTARRAGDVEKSADLEVPLLSVSKDHAVTRDSDKDDRRNAAEDVQRPDVLEYHVEGGGEFTRSIRLLIIESGPAGAWHIVVEMIVSMVLGCLTSFSFGYGQCVTPQIVVVATFGTYLAYVTVRRPFRSYYVQGATMLIAALELATSIVSLTRTVKFDVNTVGDAEAPLFNVVSDGTRLGKIETNLFHATLAVVIAKAVIDVMLNCQRAYRCVMLPRSPHEGRPLPLLLQDKPLEVVVKSNAVTIGKGLAQSPSCITCVEDAIQCIMGELETMLNSTASAKQADGTFETMPRELVEAMYEECLAWMLQLTTLNGAVNCEPLEAIEREVIACLVSPLEERLSASTAKYHRFAEEELSRRRQNLHKPLVLSQGEKEEQQKELYRRALQSILTRTREIVSHTHLFRASSHKRVPRVQHSESYSARQSLVDASVVQSESCFLDDVIKESEELYDCETTLFAQRGAVTNDEFSSGGNDTRCEVEDNLTALMDALPAQEVLMTEPNGPSSLCVTRSVIGGYCDPMMNYKVAPTLTKRELLDGVASRRSLPPTKVTATVVSSSPKWEEI